MKALEIKNLKKSYPNGFQALKGVNLSVNAGDFFALLGPNGAGKTTLIGIVSSLVNKSSGDVKVFDADLDQNRELAKSYIGLVPQEFNFSIFEKVEQIVMNQAGYYGLRRKLARERSEKYLKQLDLWDKRQQPARNLSGGMKRRLMIARALVHEPKLLILDEPTAGVDIEIRRSMWGFLRDINAQGTTIILTTHYLEEAESLCRHIAIINRGEIIENTNMQNLLNTLNVESFVLYLKEAIETLPTLTGYELRLLDAKTLEVDVRESQTMNELFSKLHEKGVMVNRLRNKSNRLEELFMRLINEKEASRV